ncbi:MAG: serine/threonine protein phosphatase [Pirellulaceae bacterium]|nr:serine/threonine protein phosphatase [Pirellulaceae bacterium]
MSGRLIAIGDIHGCRAALETLWKAIDPQPTDCVVTLGDYVDRGPDTKGVIDRLIEYSGQCQLVAIQGNHEEMMLDVVREGQPPYRWLQYGGVDTLDSYKFSGDLKVIPPEHHVFFNSMVDYFETEDFMFVHANYDPELPLAEQNLEMLRWAKLSEVLPPPHISGKRVVVGHTHDRAGQIFDVGHLICIDTYCYGGGWLTALDVHSGKVWQADRQGRLKA